MTNETDSLGMRRSLERRVGRSERVVTDALGFRLEVTLCCGDYPTAGTHRTYQAEDGRVSAEVGHRLEIQDGLDADTLAEVAAHEVYHLFFAVRLLIAVDEETEAEVFGQLVKRIHALAAGRPPNGNKLSDAFWRLCVSPSGPG